MSYVQTLIFSVPFITNHNNHPFYATSVRNFITKHFPKIFLIWIRSHIGITGNENADDTCLLHQRVQ